MVVLKVTLLLYRGVTGVIAWMPGSVHLSHTWGCCPTAVMSPNERPLSSGHPRRVRIRRRHRLRERSPSDWCCDVTPEPVEDTDTLCTTGSGVGEREVS